MWFYIVSPNPSLFLMYLQIQGTSSFSGFSSNDVMLWMEAESDKSCSVDFSYITYLIHLHYYSSFSWLLQQGLFI
jgi:hypothetical protein